MQAQREIDCTGGTGSRQAPRRPLVLALLLLLAALPFLPAQWGDLVYDDLLLVGMNPNIRSLANLGEVFSTGYWDFLPPEEATRIGYWRPLTSVALILGYRLGSGHTLPFHLLSLAAHLACVWLVFRIVRRLGAGPERAFWAALLFGVHPAMAESVAWIAAINDPLAGMFVFLALDAFLGWRRGEGRSRPWPAGLWLLLGLLTKETALVALPLAVVLDLARSLERDGEGRRRGAKAAFSPLVTAYLPMLLALLAYLVARMLVFGEVTAGFDRQGGDNGMTGLSLLLSFPRALGDFLSILVWPFSSQAFRPLLPATDLLSRPVLVPLLICFGCGVLLVLILRRGHLLLSVGMLVILAGLLPVLAATNRLGPSPLADRYLYVSLLGYGLVIATLVPCRRLPGTVLLLATALLFGLTTSQRTATWESNLTFMRIAAEECPHCPYALRGLAKARYELFLATGNREDLGRAREGFRRSLELTLRAKSGDQSIYATEEDELQSRLGLACCDLALAGDRIRGRRSELFSELVGLFPSSHHVWTNLGVAQAMDNRMDLAERSFRKALALNPLNCESLHNLARVLNQLDRWDEAVTLLDRALWRRGDNLPDLLLLAECLVRLGRYDRARGICTRGLDRLEAMVGTRRNKQQAGRRFRALLARCPDPPGTGR